MIGKEVLNYVIVSQIGSGGMGTVYLAEHKFIQQQKVAIKVINGNSINDIARERIKQEAQLLASLNHPNIVKFLNYDIDAEGNVYLVMEFAEGMTLDKYINTQTGLIVESKILPIIEPILDAFDYAHKKHVVHRDIKPANIMIGTDGVPKILDFGISTLLTDDNDSNKQETFIMGTPSYMSPEQVKGRGIDTRSDIYSLGVLLHQMLTGNAPYDTTTLTEFDIQNKVVTEPLPRMKSYYHYVSDKVQIVVDKATAKEPNDRYQTCAEFKKAIHKAIVKEKLPKSTIIIIAAVLIVLIGGGVGIWDYTRTKVRYYKDYAEQWGVPQGIGRLSIFDVHQREHSYKMEYSRGKLRHIQLVNSNGYVTTHTDTELSNSRFSEVKYFYTDNGNLDYKEVYNEYGDKLFRIDYSENLLTATFRRDDKYGTEMNIRAKTTAVTNVDNSQKSAITRYLLKYDDNGYLVEKRYAGFQNILVSDADNIYGVGYINDEKGRVIETRFLNRNGDLASNSDGLAIKTFSYDENDDWTGVTYLNTERGSSHDGNNCTVVKLVNDDYGNRIGEFYYTLEGQPSCRNDYLCFGFTYQFKDGHRITQTSIGSDGNPTYNKYRYVTIKNSFNEYGYVVRADYYDAKDSLCECVDLENGVYYYSYEINYDKNGRVLSYEMFGKDGKLSESNGVAKWEYKYDEWGNEIAQINYSSKNRLALDADYVSQYNFYYDSLHQLIKMECIDTLGNLTINKDGYAYVKISYDIHGQRVAGAFYDDKGTPVMITSRYSSYKNEYNEAGRLVKSQYFDTKGNLSVISSGYAEEVLEYDESTGFNTSIIQYDASGKLIRCEKYEYDDRGNIIKNYAVDANGNIVNKVVFNYKYDIFNRQIEFWSTDLNGERIDVKSIKYCSVKKKYDENGNAIEITFWDKYDNPATDDTKTHKRVHEYDVFNRLIHEINYGVNGKPISGKGTNPEGVVVYDKFGNISELACFDGYGVPILDANGVHKTITLFNDDNLLVQTKYLDTRGNLVVNKEEGYAQLDGLYDDKRNCIESKYFDADGKCTILVKYKYNSHNNEIERIVSDGLGKANDKLWGYTKCVAFYEEDEVTPIKIEWYDSKGKIFTYKTFDKKTGEWSDWKYPKESRSVNTSTKTVLSAAELQDVANNINKELPIDLGKNWLDMKLVECKASNGTLIFYFSLPMSKYQLSDTEIDTIKNSVKGMVAQLVKNYNCKTLIVVKDKADRVL